MSDLTTQMMYARGYDQAKHGQFSSARTLYARSRRESRRGRLRSLWARDSRRLLDLCEIEGACRIDARHYAGLHTVPIEQIRGSEGRSNDFDRDFYPLQDHCKERWLRLAAAREQGKVLPPVALIQVGDVYFVRDGHHRISVARALGQLDVEAEVTVWHLSGQMPCKSRANQDTRDAVRSKAREPERAPVWLRSLVAWCSRARKLAPAHPSAAA